MSRVHELFCHGALHSFCQPILWVDGTLPVLHSVECLSRGQPGTPFENAAILFDYARRMFAEAEADLCAAAVALNACSALPTHVAISLNVHASSLSRRPRFAHELLAVAARMGIATSRLTIEVLEQAPSVDEQILLQNISVLRSNGAQIALDDFGTGHSNFQILASVRPEIVKLDRTIVDGIRSNLYKRAIARSLSRMAEEVGTTIIAEGVECMEDLGTVQELGIRLAQGFALVRPFPTRRFHFECNHGTNDLSIPEEVFADTMLYDLRGDA